MVSESTCKITDKNMVPVKTFTIAGVVPAAGVSARMGCDKRRLPLGASTLLEATVSNLVDGGCSPVVVIVEPDSPCARLPLLQGPTVSVVRLEYPSPSMRASICAGLRALASNVQAAAVMPGDCPLVAATVIRSILDSYRQLRPMLYVPTYHDQQGHPRILAREVFRDVCSMADDDRFSTIFQRRAADVVRFETGVETVVMDADTQSDYARLLEYSAKTKAS